LPENGIGYSPAANSALRRGLNFETGSSNELEDAMKIIIPGGSGQVGTVLARAFHADGHEVVVLSRHPGLESWRVVEWDGQTLGSWRNEIDGCDVVINLAGRSVNCRYNAMNRAEILESRVLSTRVSTWSWRDRRRWPAVCFLDSLRGLDRRHSLADRP
jgi:NAD dependent epimerase/dehydratase family enzyme